MSDYGDPTSIEGAARTLGIRRVTGDSGGLATAIGLQASGLRAQADLSSAELTASLDLLAQAARRRLPLVVRLQAPGDHRAYHAAAATGAVQFFAAGAQEVADLSLIARRVAEQALVPALVANDGDEFTTAEAELSAEAASRFLGHAGDVIHPPTSAQVMLFGKHRRRVPRWHDVDRPLLTGVVPDRQTAMPVAAAGRACFDAHLPELLEQTFEAFFAETGRRYDALRGHRVRRAKLLLIVQGSAVLTAETVAEQLRAAHGPKVGVVGIRTLRPLPAEQLAELLRGRRAVAVLERVDSPAGSDTPLAAELRPLLGGERLTTAIYGLGASRLRQVDLDALCHELATSPRRGARQHGAVSRSPIYLGLNAATATGYPKQQAHLDALYRDYPRLARLGLRAAGDTAPAADDVAAGRTPPAAVRRMASSSTPIADLAGFWDRASVHTRGGGAADLIPDPFLASGTVPPMAAALVAQAPAPSGTATMLPAFEPGLCTGCGDCWSTCPDGAIAPLAIGARALLDFGMRRAGRRGRSVDKLRMVTSKLADRIKTTVAGSADAGGRLGDVLDAAFEPLIDKMKLPDERKAAICSAYMAVREELAEVPVARTEPFFESGDLFTLAIDPDACKGCGLCVAECEPKALVATGDAVDRVSVMSLWRLAEELPSPGEDVFERARSHPDVGPLAAALLSRQARDVMSATTGSEAGSGEALAARQVLGLAVALRQPILERQRAEVEELRAQLAAAIHEQLSEALPDHDLEALARGLDALDQPDAELAELTERVETAFETERVDVPGTRRLVEAGRQLADLAWRLEKGEVGLGRSPFSVVLAGSPAVWGGSFPHNPFAVPATVAASGSDSAGAAAMARGLLEGQVQQALDHARALRRARSELERAKGRRDHAGEQEISWQTLSAEERELCPPLILLAAEADLGGAGLAATLAALDTDLPLRIVALSDGIDMTAHLGLLALTIGEAAYVVQTSIAGDDLGSTLGEALAHAGPVFIRILAPSPGAGDVAADATLELARATVDAGDFTLWSSDPEARSHGSRIDLLLAPPAAQEPLPEDEVAAPEQEPELESIRAAELEQRHAAEIAAMRAQYEAQIAGLHAGLKAEMAQQVRGKLMQLVAGARGAASPGAGSPATDSESPEAER